MWIGQNENIAIGAGTFAEEVRRSWYAAKEASRAVARGSSTVLEPRMRVNDWKTGGQINQALIVCAGHRSGTEEEQIEGLLEAAQLPHELIAFKERRADRFLESLAYRERSGIVLSGNAADLFALREPEGLMHLIRTRRVPLIAGPITLPLAGTPTCPVDLVMADWEAVAAGITSDLLHKGSTVMPKATVFPARAYLQTSLNYFAQSL